MENMPGVGALSRSFHVNSSAAGVKRIVGFQTNAKHMGRKASRVTVSNGGSTEVTGNGLLFGLFHVADPWSFKFV